MNQIDQVLALLRQALGRRGEPTFTRARGLGAVRVRRQRQHAVLSLRRRGNGAFGDQDLVVLDHAGDREREELRTAGVNFVDLAGPVHLNLPFLVVDRDRPLPVVQTERRRFTTTTEQVIHTLLTTTPHDVWSTRELAEAAAVSPAAVSRATRDLLRLGLIANDAPGARTRSRIRVPDRERLLLAWAEQNHWAEHPRVDVLAPIGSARRWLMEVDRRLDVRWALTLDAGAALYAPHAAETDIHMYVDVEDTKTLPALALELEAESSARANLHLMLPRDPGAVWGRIERRQGLPVVEPHRLVVDLWNYPIRGREQAEHLIETILRPRWEAANGA